MSSLSNSTTDIEIRQPELWNLILRLGETAVKFILYNEEEENSLISRELPLESPEVDYLKALENCIYDNPVLIQDYKKVVVSVCSRHFVVLPADFTGEDDMNDIMSCMYAGDAGEYCLSELVDGENSVAFTMPRGVMSFLQRTFNMPLIVSHLVPLCRYAAGKSEKSGITKMFVHLYDNCMDMCIFRKGQLLVTNTFQYRNVEETAYYMLSAWQHFGLNAEDDELQLSADKSERDAVTPILRKYVSYVMPIMFPSSAMRIGRDAIKAPFDLILLSQCVL